jgi:hypothetical protein
MLRRYSLYLGGLITFAAATGATLENRTDAAASTTAATRLADAQQCPVSPKPVCSAENCGGSHFVGATQFVCGNENPFIASDGRSIILAGCRCCPLPTFVWCNDCYCGAPENTRICATEELQGCLCETATDRTAAVEAAADEFVWRSDDSVELDLEPSSDDEEGQITSATSSAQYRAMATLGPLQLWALQDMWGMDKLRKFY